jgi:hypothetical protein
MAVTRIVVRIGSVAAPAGREFDAADLQRRVELELADLLRHRPLTRRPTADVTLAHPGGTVRAASLSTPSSVAYAIARGIHDRLESSQEQRWPTR